MNFFFYTNVFHCFCFVYFEIIQNSKQKAKQCTEHSLQSYKTQIKILDFILIRLRTTRPRSSAFRFGYIYIIFPIFNVRIAWPFFKVHPKPFLVLTKNKIVSH